MFSNVDGAIKAFSDEVKKFRAELTAQNDRMASRLIEAKVERHSLNPDLVQHEIDVFTYKDAALASLASRAKDIRTRLNDALSSYEANLALEANPSVNEESQSGNGWFGRLMGRQNQVVHSEPQMSNPEVEQFNSAIKERISKLASLVVEIENLVDDGKTDLSNWMFHFKERVVDLSKRDSHKNLVEISLYESLISVISHHASLYKSHPFKLDSFDQVEPEMDTLARDLDDALSASLAEGLAL